MSADPPTRRVLLLGHDARTLLASARSLGRAGVTVDVAWCTRDSPVLRSRFVRRFLDLPTPAGDDRGADWAGRLSEAVEREAYDLVLPVSESALVPLQADRGRWTGTPVVLVEPIAFDTFGDKAKTAALAERVGIPVPRSTPVPTADALREISAAATFPLVVKPDRSVRAEASERKDFATVVASPDELSAAVRDLLDRGAAVLVQEHVPGRGVGVEVLAHEGEILTALQHVRLHETTGHGSTYRESVPLDPELLDWTARLVRELGFTGLAMAEYRVGERRVLLEVNARMWGSMPLAVAAGASFPLYLYRLLVDGDREPPRDYRVGVRSRDLYADARWTMRSLSGRSDDAAGDGSSGWQINRVSRTKLTRDTLRGLFGRDHVDSFAWDDPRPVLTDLARIARLVGRKPFRGLSGRSEGAILGNGRD